MEALLINKTDLSQFKQISKALQIDKTDEYVREAQTYDLIPLMGTKFFFDMLSKRTHQKYVNLINGGTYTVDGIQYSFNGIKAVLAYFAYARLVLTVDAVNSPFGMNRKLQPDTEPLSHSEKKDIRMMAIQSANMEWEMCVHFIESYPAEYPLWNESCCGTAKNYSRLKIDKI